MLFACIMEYSDDKSLVTQVRPEHRIYMRGLIEAGHAVAAGSFPPNDDGGLFLYKADDRETAQKFVDEDPYILHGAATRYQLHQYEVHGANPALLLSPSR